MARVKINLPDKFQFSTEMRVRVTDLNYGGHLGNDKFLSLIHEARMRFLQQFGFSELNIEGVGLVVVDAVVVYKCEVFLSEVLTFEVAVDGINRNGCDFFFKISSKASGREVARAKTGVVFFDFEKRRMVKTPQQFEAVFGPQNL
ncbi:MAG: acyl-CoA thioesterase [bacterium]